VLGGLAQQPDFHPGLSQRFQDNADECRPDGAEAGDGGHVLLDNHHLADAFEQRGSRCPLAEPTAPERFSVAREELMSIVNDAVRNTERRW
jgi:hypothetical protein